MNISAFKKLIIGGLLIPGLAASIIGMPGISGIPAPVAHAAPALACSTINLASGTNTLQAGFTETNPTEAAALLPSSYSGNALNAALITQPVVPPWIDPATDAVFTGSGASWISTDASWPGGSGNSEGLPGNDQWRLFQDGFTIPAGAVNITANVSYTADNATAVYLNGSFIARTGGATDDVYGPVPGDLPLVFSGSFTNALTPAVGTNTLNFVVRNWGGPFNPNPTGLLYKAAVNYCLPTSVQVHLFKYLDGVQATADTAGGVSFPMLTSFSDPSVGTAANVPFTLNPNGWTTGDIAYEASTGPRTPGSSASFSEDTTGSLVGTDCANGAPYALLGYQVGTSLEAATAATSTLTAPNFESLASDEYVIVNNHVCPPPTLLKVHIAKYLDGVQATALTANNYQFPMIATWKTANLNNGGSTSGNYVLGNFHGGAPLAYQADTAPMQAPADYTTSEITDNTSNVLPSDASCVAGKYRLDGYQASAVSFADAATQATTTAAPIFTALTGDEYVIVRNVTCPTTGTLTIEKDTIGGNGTFTFTSDIPGGATFNVTTTENAGAQTFTNLAPGTYHVSENTLKGWTMTENECASVTIAAGDAAICTITNTNNKLLGEIRGTKYADRDGDGTLKDGDHHRLAGWTIYLDTNNNGALDGGEPSMVTDSHGNYHFSSLPAGTYHVREVGQPGWIQTYPASGSYTIVLAAGKISKKDNFGNFKLGSITGMKFNDANGNGRKDSGEVGLAGWTINLTKVGSPTVVSSTVTDANGNYSFSNLGPGTYQVREVQQAGWIQITKNPSNIKMLSGTVSKNNNFGNHFGPVTKGKGHDGDKDGDDDHDGHYNS